MPTTPPPDDKDKPKPFAPIVAASIRAGRIGVRLVFEKDGTCVIGGLVRGGPAFDVGFRVGDTVIKIDKNLRQLALARRGEAGAARPSRHGRRIDRHA